MKTLLSADTLLHELVNVYKRNIIVAMIVSSSITSIPVVESWLK